MAEYKQLPQFLGLPRELRDMIYDYLLPDVDEVCMKPGFKLDWPYEGDIQWCEDLFELRQNGDHCYPAILMVSKHLYAEASQILWNRTYTITLSDKGVSFLRKHYYSKTYHGPWSQNDAYLESFPVSFPFHKAKAIRVRVDRTYYGPCATESFRVYTKELGHELGKIAHKELPWKKLIIDACGLESYMHTPVQCCEATCRLYPSINYLFELFSCSVGITQSCEIKLGGRVRKWPDEIGKARNLGRALIKGPPLDDEIASGAGKSDTDEKTAASSTRLSCSTKCPHNVEPVLLIQDQFCEHSEGCTGIDTKWYTRITRVQNELLDCV